MDPAVIAYIGALHDHFMQSHARVHEDFVVSHEREHGLEDTATATARALAAEKLEREVAHIKEFYNTILVERDRRFQERFDAQVAAIHAALDASEEAVTAALNEKEKAVAAAFESSERAINKAEISIEKRADATYVSLTELTRSLGDLMPRAESDVRIGNLEERLSNLNSRQDRQDGQSRGISTSAAVLATVITIVISLVGVMIVLLSR